ncbi:hypothetical protein ACJMK2_043724 [Sinanodonta woodiana]|uniref:CARD domain-containing protein n=1 Tax=Sinanodonta woodiana TaxID=1069815 RepID=A0ABD3VXW1_SINWO
MNDIHREVFKRRYRYLFDNIIMEHRLCKALQDKGIFTEGMVNLIMNEAGHDRQLQKMLEWLPRRGPKAFDAFLEVIIVDYAWVVDNLKECEQDIISSREAAKTDDIQPEVKRSVKDHVKDLARTTRLNQAQQKAIEEFLCRHMVDDRHMVKSSAPMLYKLHRMLMSCIPLNTLDESDQMDLNCGPESVTLEKIEKEVALLTQRMSDIQSTVDSCYDRIGETNKDKELPDLIFSMRKSYLEKDIRLEEMKKQVVLAHKNLRVTKEKLKKLQEANVKQEEEKGELEQSLESLKQKIIKLSEERQKLGMRQAFDTLSTFSSPVMAKKSANSEKRFTEKT